MFAQRNHLADDGHRCHRDGAAAQPPLTARAATSQDIDSASAHRTEPPETPPPVVCSTAFAPEGVAELAHDSGDDRRREQITSDDPRLVRPTEIGDDGGNAVATIVWSSAASNIPDTTARKSDLRRCPVSCGPSARPRVIQLRVRGTRHTLLLGN